MQPDGSASPVSLAATPLAPALPGARVASRSQVVRRSTALTLVLVLWGVVFFDPHRWLTVYLPDIVEKLPLMFFMVTLLYAVPRLPPLKWYPQLLFYLAGLVVTIPFARNIGFARDSTKIVVLAYALLVATLCIIKRPRDLVPVFVIILASFAWWGLWGVQNGLVIWHPAYANQDGFGPLMCIGMGYAYYLGMASTEKRLKWISFAIAGLCLIGVVTSFARGAVLSLAALAVIIWVRSPHKIRTLVGGTLGLAVLLVSVRVLFPQGEFWREMESSFTEGTEQGTGADRWALWQTAIKVFEERPVFGVGAGNFGAFAAATFQPGEVPGDYAANPATLYGRNTHSIYFTLLSEQGAFGVAAFLLLLVDFWRRNRKLRKPAAVAVFAEESGGRFNLQLLALALEAAMVAYLLSGFFYAQHYMHWFYSLLVLNVVLHATVMNALRVRALQAAQLAAQPPIPARR